MAPEGEVCPSADPLFGRVLDARALAVTLAEPLVESAPVAFATAMQHCAPDSACQGYHAVWQYQRLARLAPSVQVDGPIYVAVAERLARAGKLRRVLISASADYSMLAHLAYGARLGGADPQFDVVDRCATPLRLNEWYGTRKGIKVRTIRACVTEFGNAGPYDLICTHSLLALLPAPHRPRLFEQWRSCLGTAGRVCFSNRVWTDHIMIAPDEADRRTKAMAETVVRELERIDVPLPCERDHFTALLERYRERYGHRQPHLPPLPQSDVERWITDAGLAIEIAVPASQVVPEIDDRKPDPFRVQRGPRIWFQLRRG